MLLKDLVDVECIEDTITFKTHAIRLKKDQFFWFTSEQVPELKERLKRLIDGKQFQKQKTGNLIKPRREFEQDENLIKPIKTLHRNLSLQNNLNVKVSVKKDRDYVNIVFPRIVPAKSLDYANADIIQSGRCFEIQLSDYLQLCRMKGTLKRRKTIGLGRRRYHLLNISWNPWKSTNYQQRRMKEKRNFRKPFQHSQDRLSSLHFRIFLEMHNLILRSNAYQDIRYQNWTKATHFVKALRKKKNTGISKVCSLGFFF